MYKKILFFVVAVVSLVSGQYAPNRQTIICSSDNQCTSGDLCVRSVCMSPQQLKIVAEVYAPQEALVTLQRQFASPDCQIAADCDEAFDRCHKGACLSSSSVALYQQEVSQAFVARFGEIEIPVQTSRQCVTDTQCIAGDLCFDGSCLPFFTAEREIMSKVARHMELKASPVMNN